MVSRRPRRCPRLAYFNVQPELSRPGVQRRQVNFQTLGAFRRHRERHLARGQHVPVPGNRPVQHFVIGVAEQIAALHLNHQRRGADPRKGKELLGALRLVQRRVRRAIGEHQPVKTELPIVRLIAEVSAVGPERVALFVPFRQGLIDPVPDKPTLQARMAAKRFPVFRNPAKAISHRVGVFTEDQRARFVRHADPFLD